MDLKLKIWKTFRKLQEIDFIPLPRKIFRFESRAGFNKGYHYFIAIDLKRALEMAEDFEKQNNINFGTAYKIKFDMVNVLEIRIEDGHIKDLR